MVWESLSGTLHEMDLSYECPQAEMSESRMVLLLALLCSFIALVGFAAVVPWDYIWRSCQNHMATRMANTGMTEESIEALPSIIYGKSIQQLPGISIATDCPICLVDFVEGEGVRVLPSCNHCFHVECIDKWLHSHSSCPTCRRCLRHYRYKKRANYTRHGKANAHEGQLHQPRTTQESQVIFDIESGIKQSICTWPDNQKEWIRPLTKCLE